MKIVIASHNEGKISEFKQMLQPLGYQVMSVKDLGVGVSEIIEDGDSFNENALIKAKHVYDLLKIPVLSDDSGLVLEAFPNLLGIHSARYLEGQPYSEKHKSLQVLYKGVNNTQAYFKTALVFYNGQSHTFEGTVHGSIAPGPKGNQGFGYDPIFIPKGQTQTFAEMGPKEKSKISHRSLALEKFLDYLKEEKQ